jgi:hypothetical protein
MAGQNIDVRGVGREVLRRMDLENALRDAGTGERGLAVVDGAGRVRAAFRLEEFGSNRPTAELEILRGDLARLPAIGPWRTWNTSSQTPSRHWMKMLPAWRLTFRSGARPRVDLVLAAKGIGSSARRLPFGDGGRRFLGLNIAYFTIAKDRVDDDLARIYNMPGGRVVNVRPNPKGTTPALLSIRHPPDGAERPSSRTAEAHPG